MITSVLTIKSGLALHADGSYQCELNSDAVRADEIVANGVTIDAGAPFNALPIGSGVFTAGTMFTLISHVSSRAISGALAIFPTAGQSRLAAILSKPVTKVATLTISR
jgi:hypothetical protein